MSGLKAVAMRMLAKVCSEDSQPSTAASAENAQPVTEDPPSVVDLASQLSRVHVFTVKLSSVLSSWYEKCDVADTLHLCPKLDKISAECGQMDRLVVAGNGNVGKSTVVNALLGERRFWPTASFCMTSCICETHYGDQKAYADGGTEVAIHCQTIPQKLVYKSAASQPDEFKSSVRCVCKAWTPSELLKSSVVLVDLPGLDQEKEYMQVLKSYMKQHPAHAAVLVYVLDVKRKTCNSDRSFFQELMRSSWMPLSQGLHLLVNKCDAVQGSETDEDEPPPPYKSLMEDIERDACNYCTPKLFPLSMKDRKAGVEDAVFKWDAVVADLRSALTNRKSLRLRRSSDDLRDVIQQLESKLNDSERRVEQMQQQIEEAEALRQQFKDSSFKDSFVNQRAKEMRDVLEERREDHLQAVFRSTPHLNRRVGVEQLKEVDQFIVSSVQVMIANDIQASANMSSVLSSAVSSLGIVAGIGSLLALGEGGASAAAAVFLLWPAAVAAACVITAGTAAVVGLWCLFAGTLVSEDHVRQRFHEFYLHQVDKTKELAEKEYTTLRDAKSREVQALKDSLTEFLEADLQRLVKAGFGEEFEQLRAEYAELMQLTSQVLTTQEE